MILPAGNNREKWLGRPIKLSWHWGKRIAGVSLAFVGLAGLPDDITTWSIWIDDIVSAPLLPKSVQLATELVELVNKWWIRGPLIVAGLSLFAWAWRPFWRLRHKWLFQWRRIVSEQVWISQEDAIKIVKASRWGRIKEPNVVRTVSALDAMINPFNRERTVYGLSETQKNLLKFDVFLEKTLDSFCNSNPTACRIEAELREIDEAPLRDFLRLALDEEVSDEFGDVPDYKVT